MGAVGELEGDGFAFVGGEGLEFGGVCFAVSFEIVGP